jgi:O-acetyl-ADP-ribose deacetylase
MGAPAPQPSPFERLECALGDLTCERVDAIVNAANSALRGGGGVDGAIHRAAGPELLAEILQRYPEGCPTGEVRITSGHRLPARRVIHAVGPIWRGGGELEAERMASCYSRALEVASAEELCTISFPAISCGVYGYPWDQAAEIALATLAGALERLPRIERVRMVLLGPELFELHAATRERLAQRWRPSRGRYHAAP